MSKSALAKHLTKVFKGRDLVKDAEALNLRPEVLEELIEGLELITVPMAIAIAKLTNTDPAVLLNAQTESQLAMAGVKMTGHVTLKPLPKPPATDAAPARGAKYALPRKGGFISG